MSYTLSMRLTNLVPKPLQPDWYRDWVDSRQRLRKEREDARRWAAFVQAETEAWPGRWRQCRSLQLGDRSSPALVDMANYPAGSRPHYRVYLFKMSPGTQFADYEQCARELAAILDCQMVVVERFNKRKHDDPEEHLAAFSVSVSLRDLGHMPHLNADLDQQTAEFAIRWAVIRAFNGLQMSSPMVIWAAAHRAGRYDRGEIVLWETACLLPENLTVKEVINHSDDLRNQLRCEHLEVWHTPQRPHWFHLVSGRLPENLNEDNRKRYDAQKRFYEVEPQAEDIQAEA